MRVVEPSVYAGSSVYARIASVHAGARTQCLCGSERSRAGVVLGEPYFLLWRPVVTGVAISSRTDSQLSLIFQHPPSQRCGLPACPVFVGLGGEHRWRRDKLHANRGHISAGVHEQTSSIALALGQVEPLLVSAVRWRYQLHHDSHGVRRMYTHRPATAFVLGPRLGVFLNGLLSGPSIRMGSTPGPQPRYSRAECVSTLAVECDSPLGWLGALSPVPH